jgi:hypothetical protein
MVVAMVGDKAILMSQIDDDVERWLASRTPGTPSPDPLWTMMLELAISHELRAQSAKFLGRSPAEVDEQVERILQEEMRKEAEASGGVNEYTKQLGLIGKSWAGKEEEVRSRIRAYLAHQQGVLRDINDQKALLVTPLELRRYFDAHRRELDQEPSVDIGQQRFPLSAGAAAARAQADALVAKWRALPQVTAEQVKADGGAVTLRQSPRTALAAIAGFIAEAKVGQVSDPLDDGQHLWVIACLARTEGKRAQFDDPEVQEAIREDLQREKMETIARRFFEAHNVGVERFPWGDPRLLRERRRGARN